eukprot:4265412-Alexandrium_andersonii.AAC.1
MLICHRAALWTGHRAGPCLDRWPVGQPLGPRPGMVPRPACLVLQPRSPLGNGLAALPSTSRTD